MKKLVLMLAAAASLCFAAEERNTVQRSFTVNPAEAKLVVEAVNGSITATGYQGSEIRVTVQERYTGDTIEDVQRARNEVRLEMEQQGNTVRLYVDRPSRNRDGNQNTDRNYGARFDFEVQVPVQASVDLRTVNGGRVAVSGTTGSYSVQNVNGAIELKQIGGSGTANTVNGKVTVAFQSNPKEPCTFKTVNGDIDAAFQPGLSADLSVRTVHGQAWTDLPEAALTGTGSNLPGRGARLRAGSGGPQLNLETVNGSVRITGRGV